jgi:hypothetical protein
MPRRPQDAHLFVKFSRRSVLNQAKSYGEKILDNNNNVVEEITGAGRPIHDNVDYIYISIPGDRDNIVERPVECCDKRLRAVGAKLTPLCRARLGPDDKPMLEECDVHRFFDEFFAFKSGQEDQQVGQDLKGWPGIDPASIEDLAYFKVHTVEQLAAMNDSNVGQFFALRQRARDYLDEAKKGAASINVRAELDASAKALQAERDARQALEKQVAELIAAQPKPAQGKAVSR